MTATHHLDGDLTEPGPAGTVRSVGQGWLDYANTAFQQASTLSGFTLDVDIAARLGLGYEMGRLAEAFHSHAAVMADLVTELRADRRSRTAVQTVDTSRKPQLPADEIDRTQAAG